MYQPLNIIKHCCVTHCTGNNAIDQSRHFQASFFIFFTALPGLKYIINLYTYA